MAGVWLNKLEALFLIFLVTHSLIGEKKLLENVKILFLISLPLKNMFLFTWLNSFIKIAFVIVLSYSMFNISRLIDSLQKHATH